MTRLLWSRPRFRLALLGVVVSLVSFAVFFTYESPTRAASFWTLGQLLVLIVAALYAAQQVREARLDREERSRPFVVVDVDPWSKKQVLLLTVENLGRTIAQDVRISFEPKLQSTLDDDPGVVRAEWWPDVADFKIFREGIENLPPGKRLACHLDISPKLFHRTDLPKRYEATVTYRGPNDSYEETYVLDLAMYRELPMSITDD